MGYPLEGNFKGLLHCGQNILSFFSKKESRKECSFIENFFGVITPCRFIEIAHKLGLQADIVSNEVNDLNLSTTLDLGWKPVIIVGVWFGGFMPHYIMITGKISSQKYSVFDPSIFSKTTYNLTVDEIISMQNKFTVRGWQKRYLEIKK